MKKIPKYYLELHGFRDQWHYRLVCKNGRIMNWSEKYYSKSNAKKAANKFHVLLKDGICEKVY